MRKDILEVSHPQGVLFHWEREGTRRRESRGRRDEGRGKREDRRWRQTEVGAWQRSRRKGLGITRPPAAMTHPHTKGTHSLLPLPQIPHPQVGVAK